MPCVQEVTKMFRKIFAIVGALIAGGLGISILMTGAQIVLARQTDN
jgi:hypothetical protein